MFHSIYYGGKDTIKNFIRFVEKNRPWTAPYKIYGFLIYENTYNPDTRCMNETKHIDLLFENNILSMMTKIILSNFMLYLSRNMREKISHK